MKVVLFCGGQGTRLRDYSETIPKPMVNIGYRPILWNIMKYYAHFGHKDFILCLGHKADKIKDYFINYDETISNNFVYALGGNRIELLNSDIDDWKITFVDTGVESNIGMRLMRVKEYLKDEEMFLANYSDGLSNMYLPNMIEDFKAKPDMVGTFVRYQPNESFHVVEAEESGLVSSIHSINGTNISINTGYFILRNEIFDYMNYGDELVVEPFHRLIKEQKLTSYEHKGFWRAMDTFKDKMYLDDLQKKGNTPWAVWEHQNPDFIKESNMTLSQFKLNKESGLNILALGAHCDDIEIGCGGTLLKLFKQYKINHIKWYVFASNEQRKQEAINSAEAFLQDIESKEIVVLSYRDAFLEQSKFDIKEVFESIKKDFNPDLVFTHYRDDRHQDHRLLSDLAWNTFRSHLILEYEIPKYDGDLGIPNCFFHLTQEQADKKVQILIDSFLSQKGKHWFDKETFQSLMRIRGMEAAAEEKYAEAFHLRKLIM